MTREFNVVTPEHVEVNFELAGIGSRFLAILLDHLLQALFFIIVGVVCLGLGIFSFETGLGPGSMATWIFAIFIILIFVVTYGYFLFFELTRNGQTPGKKAVGIRVIRDTGHPLDFRSATLRNILRIVDALPSMYAIGLISMFVSPQYRRLGDYVGGTLVVKVGKQAVAVPAPQAAPEQPVYAQSPYVAPQTAAPSEPDINLPPQALPYITSVSKDEYRAIRHFLNRVNELEPQVAQNLATKLMTPIAQKLQMDPAQITEPVAFLMSVSREWERRSVH